MSTTLSLCEVAVSPGEITKADDASVEGKET